MSKRSTTGKATQTKKHQAPFGHPMPKKIIDDRSTPFVWFDIALDDAGLDPFSFRLYCHIARRTAGGKATFFEAITHAATHCQMSERQCRYAIKALLTRRMVQCIQKTPGYPTIYALTDKACWVPPDAEVVSPDPLTQPPPTPAPYAHPTAHSAAPHCTECRPPLHHMHTSPALDAGHEENTISKHKKQIIEAAAAANSRARSPGKAAAAAQSKFEFEAIKRYVITHKTHARNPHGLALHLYQTGEDDREIAEWLALSQPSETIDFLPQAIELAESLSQRQPDDLERLLIPSAIAALAKARPDLAQILKGLL